GLESPLVYRPRPAPCRSYPAVGAAIAAMPLAACPKSSPPWRLLHVLLGGDRLGRFRLSRLGLGGWLGGFRLRGFRLGPLALLGQVALAVAVLLEVGLVPAAAGK